VVRGHAFEGRVGIELACGGERLIAEVMRETAQALDIRPGQPIFAAVKASAFHELFGEGAPASPLSAVSR
jgi:molybdate transport system ATP-binding protein